MDNYYGPIGSNKFHGPIGYVTSIEKEPGYWTDVAVEHIATGDWIKYSGKFQIITDDSTIDDKNIAAQLSITPDPYVLEHSSDIRYIVFMGTAWKVTAIEPKFPKLILTIGGIWNGEQARAAE